jgi:SH3-like domain-containing protein
MKSFFYIPLFFFISFSVSRADRNLLPRFVSLKPNEVNSRVGPGPDYPIEWIYLKAGLPVEVIAEFDTWRKVRDVDRAEGWVHQSMLCSKRSGIIQGDEVLMYGEEDPKSQPVVRLQHGVVVDLLKCHEEWCQVRIYDFRGWVQRSSLWGVYPQEIIG